MRRRPKGSAKGRATRPGAGLPSRVLLLGPQRPDPILARTLDEIGADGPVAMITAGWQEWEGDLSRVETSLRDRVRDLELYGRAEVVWANDPELSEAHNLLQRDVKGLRRIYNVRLAHAMSALEAIERLPVDSTIGEIEAEDALEAVRELDRRHERRVAELRSEYEARWSPPDRDAVRRERDHIIAHLEGIETVVIEGGHVAVLLNRLRLFGVRELLAGRTVVACSGGAMVASERIVLFHDSPPQGTGNAEVSEAGLGLYPGVLALPNGSRRLRLDDAPRVGRLARRFAPAACAVLDSGSRLEWSGTRWVGSDVLRMDPSGEVADWSSAA